MFGLLLVSWSITVRLTYCLTSSNSATLLMFNQKQIYFFSQIQTSDTSPYKNIECSLVELIKILGGSPGLVVMGGASFSEGCGFELLHIFYIYLLQKL